MTLDLNLSIQDKQTRGKYQPFLPFFSVDGGVAPKVENGFGTDWLLGGGLLPPAPTPPTFLDPLLLAPPPPPVAPAPLLVFDGDWGWDLVAFWVDSSTPLSLSPSGIERGAGWRGKRN